VKLEDREAPVVLTPEHVPIRLTPAGLGARFMAVLTDGIIILAVCGTLGTLLQIVTLGRATALVITASFVIQWGYHVFFEVRRQGQTPGKKLCGLRVVDSRGLPITFQQSFIRNVVRALDFAPAFYGVGALSCLLTRHRRRLGDLAADTLVIQEHRPADLARALAGQRRFNSLQAPRVLRRIRRHVGLEEREFLLALCLRAEALDPRARFDLMEEAGNHYRKVLEIDDPHLSGENVVRGLLSVLYGQG
jgi:uncharacterized RDD family membrane protein YckC